MGRENWSLSHQHLHCGYEVAGMTLLRNLKGALRLDRSKHACACFKLHQLRFQRINASCLEVVVLIKRVCSYASSQKWVICFWSNKSTLSVVWDYKECKWHMCNAFRCVWGEIVQKAGVFEWQNGSKRAARTWKMIKRRPRSQNRWKCCKSAESGAFKEMFNYHSHGCASKYRERNSDKFKMTIWTWKCLQQTWSHDCWLAVKQFLTQKLIT
jgi:hypothetical protein